jgi:hypothetical protein
MGVDWTAQMRAMFSIREYILIGEIVSKQSSKTFRGTSTQIDDGLHVIIFTFITLNSSEIKENFYVRLMKTLTVTVGHRLFSLCALDCPYRSNF